MPDVLLRDIPGPSGSLEALLEVSSTTPRAAAVFAHPHPLYGGTMHTRAVYHATKALARVGAVVLRFNFRGVGASDGAHDGGPGEMDDYRAALDFVAAKYPGLPLWAAGFSFGSWVALQAARHLPLKQMISIAPPVGLRSFDGVLPPACPWLVIMGEADDLVDPQKVYAWIDSLKDKPTLVKMPDTGHFFHRRLIDLRGAIKNGVRKNLPPPRNG